LKYLRSFIKVILSEILYDYFMRFYSLLGLIILFVVANISGFILNIRNDKFFNYFHFLGGLVVTIFFFSFTNNYLTALALTFITGILWEVYEWVSWKYFLKKKKYKPMKKDTKNDLVLDMVGGVVALIILTLVNVK